MKNGEYKTQELEALKKCDEFRRREDEEFWNAPEKGELIVANENRNSIPYCLLGGLGKFHWHGPASTARRKVLRDVQCLVRCTEAVEKREEFGRDSCSLMRVAFGAESLGLLPPGKKFHADFQLDCFRCSAQAKIAQLWHDYFGTPTFSIEYPPSMAQASYFVSQVHDAIEWMERVAKRRYNDEWLIEGLRNEWESKRLWAQICEQLKARPAPVDVPILFSIANALYAGRHTRETRDLLALALDEIRDRVANQISATGHERYRLAWDGTNPIWSRLPFDYPRKYGAVFVALNLIFHWHGAWEVAPDGTLQVAPSIDELGIRLTNRDEAIQAMALLFIKYNPHVRAGIRISEWVEEVAKQQQDWKIDAFVVNEDPGCIGITLGSREKILALQKLGIPVLNLSLATREPRRFDEEEYHRNMDSFISGLGERK